jgi:hypothetical protein
MTDNCDTLRRYFDDAIGGEEVKYGVTKLQLLEAMQNLLDSKPSGQTPTKPKMFEYELEDVFKDIVCHLNRFGWNGVPDHGVFEEMCRVHLSTLSGAYSNIGDWGLVVDGQILTITVMLAPEDNEDVGKEHKCIIVYNNNTQAPWHSITHNTPPWWPIRNLEYH